MTDEIENIPPAAPVQQTPTFDPRRRLRELLSVPERDRSDEQWDEINELEIQLAPGNRIAGWGGNSGGGGGGGGGGGMSGGGQGKPMPQGKKPHHHPKKVGGPNRRPPKPPKPPQAS